MLFALAADRWNLTPNYRSDCPVHLLGDLLIRLGTRFLSASCVSFFSLCGLHCLGRAALSAQCVFVFGPGGEGGERLKQKLHSTAA